MTAVPTPHTDRGSDLFYVYEEVFGVFLFISGVGVNPRGGTFLQYDSKAMRRVNDDQDIVTVIECANTSANVMHAFRTLIKLH